MVVVDVAARRETGRLVITGRPHNVALSFDGRFAYITQAANNSLAIVDTQAKRVVATLPVGTEPLGLAIDQSTGDTRFFIADTGSDSVTVLDAAAHHTLATIPVGHEPMALAVATAMSGVDDPSGSEVYVTNSGSDSITIINATSLKVLMTIAAPGGPESIVIPQMGGAGYVGTRSGTILALRLADHQVVGKLLQLRGEASGQMDYDAVTGQIYIPDPTGNVVQILRPAYVGSPGSSLSLPSGLLRTLPFDGGPAAIAIPSDGAVGFVASRATGQVTMFDVFSRQTLATVAVGGAPIGLVTGAYPPSTREQPSNVTCNLVVVAILISIVGVATLFTKAQRRRSRARRGANSWV